MNHVKNKSKIITSSLYKRKLQQDQDMNTKSTKNRINRKTKRIKLKLKQLVKTKKQKSFFQ